MRHVRTTKRDWMLYHRWIANDFPKAPYLKHRTYHKGKMMGRGRALYLRHRTYYKGKRSNA